MSRLHKDVDLREEAELRRLESGHPEPGGGVDRLLSLLSDDEDEGAVDLQSDAEGADMLLQQLASSFSLDWRVVAAGAVVSILPVLVLFVLLLLNLQAMLLL